MFFIEGYDGAYWSEEQAMEALMQLRPDLGDDALVDYFEAHVVEDAPCA